MLKPLWKVSMAALITCATRLDLITPRQARYLWMQMGRAGYRDREPPELDFPKEEPRQLRRLIDLHRKDLHYSIGDLGNLLALHPHELAHIYPIELTVEEARGTLRAI
jgi:hypothetical protein